mgnify:FL=1
MGHGNDKAKVRSAESRWSCRRLVVYTLLMCLLLAPAIAWAQGDGPRSQQPMPVGTSVLVPTWLNMSMNSDFSQSILLVDADVDADIFLGIYIRSFAVGDRSGQIWVVPNGGKLNATASVDLPDGTSVTRSISESGMGDLYVAGRIGLVGAPALEMAEFIKHKPTFQLYAYGGLYVPTGHYDSDNLLNLGTNRWALRVGLPMIIPLGDPKHQASLEIHPGVSFYGDNNDPTGGASVKEQDPLLQVEFHVTRNFTPKLWGSIGGRYRNGGETTTDGIADQNKQDVLGGEISMGYTVNPHVSLQGTYGSVVTESDGSKSDLIRLRLAYAF